MGEALITRRGKLGNKIVIGEIEPNDDTVTVTLGFQPTRVFIMMNNTFSWGRNYAGVVAAFIDSQTNTRVNSTFTLQPSGYFYMNTNEDNTPRNILTITTTGFSFNTYASNYQNFTYLYIATD